MSPELYQPVSREFRIRPVDVDAGYVLLCREVGRVGEPLGAPLPAQRGGGDDEARTRTAKCRIRGYVITSNHLAYLGQAMVAVPMTGHYEEHHHKLTPHKG
jgi:hypothetical protein